MRGYYTTGPTIYFQEEDIDALLNEETIEFEFLNYLKPHATLHICDTLEEWENYPTLRRFKVSVTPEGMSPEYVTAYEFWISKDLRDYFLEEGFFAERNYGRFTIAYVGTEKLQDLK